VETPSILRDPWTRLGLACALSFVLLWTFVLLGDALALDVPLAAAIGGVGLPTAGWEAVTWLGGPVLVPLGVTLVIAVALTGRLRLAVILALVLLGGTLLTDVVKETVARPRPAVEHQLVAVTGFSFPSGHALNSTTAYGVVALVAWGSALHARLRLGIVAACVAAAVLVGLSRIALGVHYPTDVAGGWLAGLSLVSLGAVLVRRTRAMGRDWRPARGPGAALARRDDNDPLIHDVLPDGRVDQGAGDTPS
jgi:undecaprenyl-diphosphatase